MCFKNLQAKIFIFCVFVVSVLNFSTLHPLNFLKCSDTKLFAKSKKLSTEEIQSNGIQNLIDEMILLANGEAQNNSELKKTSLAGLAAPQVGVLKQIIIVDQRSQKQYLQKNSKPDYLVLINPEVISTSQKCVLYPEGCYSVPEKYYGLVSRPKSVKIKARNCKGELIEKTFKGYACSVFCHEFDHLNGILFPQKLSSEKSLHVVESDEELKNYKKNWRFWAKHATLDEWNTLKKPY